MPSGGSRANAGRKSPATKLQRLIAGIYMAAEWQALKEATAPERCHAADIEQARRILNDSELPSSHRERILKGVPDDDANPEVDEALLDALPPKAADAALELREIRSLLKGHQRFATYNPRGRRKEFLARMARDLSKAFGFPVSTEQARHWLDNHRARCKK